MTHVSDIALREALEGLLTEDESVRLNVQVLAPIFQRALRTAYRTGVRDMMDGLGNTSENGVTAGVAIFTAAVEGP